MRLLKICFLFTLVLGIAACSGGGTNSAGVERNNSSSSDGNVDSGELPPEDDEPDPDPETPTSVQLDGNLYFPVPEGATWVYDNGDQVDFIHDITIRGRELVAMQHSSAGMPEQEYFKVDNDIIQYGGVYANLADLPGFEGFAVEGGVEFHNLRQVYNHRTDSGWGRTLLPLNADLVDPDGVVVAEVDYYWSSVVGEKGLVDAGLMGLVPAVELRINVDLSITVGGIPLQNIPVIATSLWLSPGLGVVARSVGETTVKLEQVDAIQRPVVFAFDQGSGLDQPAKQLLVDGNPLTDLDAGMVIAYGTSATDWLALEFDGTGSWRLSITGDELPSGIQGAVVQITRNGVRTDVPVSVLVR